MRRLVWILLLAGCSAKSDATAPVVVSLTGTYTGGYQYFQSPDPNGYQATVGMTQTGANVAGTIYLPSGTQAIPLTGTYSSDTLKLAAVYPLPSVGRWDGVFSVSDGGKHLVGRLTGVGSVAGQVLIADLTKRF